MAGRSLPSARTKEASAMGDDRSLVNELVDLIRIPSVTGEEAAIASHLRDRLAASGRPVVSDRTSLLIPPPEDGRPLIVLAGHLDTVPPRGNATPRVEGEWVWGRGAADMKGGLAVLVRLMEDAAVASGWARLGAILYAGEEGPLDENDLKRLLDGSGKWAEGAALAILLEPTDVQIEVGCLGVVNLEATFLGEACHSARPWTGRSAIGEALPWLERILRFENVTHSVGPFLFRETAQVTLLKAGAARNMVPGELTANLNYRYPPGWDPERGRAAALTLAEEAAEVRIVDEAPAGDVPIGRPVFDAFLARTGLPARAKQAWTDVAQLSRLGVPAVNFGPGDPALAHRDDERVHGDALDGCLSVLRRFLIEGEAP
ncbi:MAG: succinyl-diaminopimelate desuccinylase [Candidatus Eisenbacteria bacterium]|nr:succinyl-diaminopimelate desuccinylase [Candidatus Latescibacterota bacterium]MBD3303181.1 succinyl-diaminopimelate desuccinylase [Candidatus Eisenbacteria bacterium]